MQLLNLNSVDRNCVEKFTFQEDFDREDKLFKADTNSSIEIKIDIGSINEKMKLKKCENISLDSNNNAKLLDNVKNMNDGESNSSLNIEAFDEFDYADNDIFTPNSIESKKNISKLDSSSNVDTCPANNGYCVDSVEPKCNEIKRLIDEFKTNYLSKFSLIKSNRALNQKLLNVRKRRCVWQKLSYFFFYLKVCHHSFFIRLLFS